MISRSIDAIVFEIAADHAIYRRPGGVDFGRQWTADAWRTLAERDVAMPHEIYDPYTACGPHGPPRVPETWRGRSFRELLSPYEPLALAEHLRLPVVALANGLAVLRI